MAAKRTPGRSPSRAPRVKVGRGWGCWGARPGLPVPSLWVLGWLKSLNPWGTGQQMDELTQGRPCGGEVVMVSQEHV